MLPVLPVIFFASLLSFYNKTTSTFLLVIFNGMFLSSKGHEPFKNHQLVCFLRTEAKVASVLWWTNVRKGWALLTIRFLVLFCDRPPLVGWAAAHHSIFCSDLKYFYHPSKKGNNGILIINSKNISSIFKNLFSNPPTLKHDLRIMFQFPCTSC